MQMAWVLLQSGAQTGLQDKKGCTALHHAVTRQDKVSTVIHRQGGRWWLVAGTTVAQALLHLAVTKQDKVSTVIHRQGGRWWLHRRACGMSRIVGMR